MRLHLHAKIFQVGAVAAALLWAGQGVVMGVCTPVVRTSVSGAVNWGTNTSWSPGAVPQSCDPVTIIAGSTVTVDGVYQVSTVTVNGDLYFSRVVSSTLTIVGGNVTVNAGGTLDLGSASSPISASSATLILAYGSSAGQYGLIINDGGAFITYGSTKTTYSTAVSTANAGSSTISVKNSGLVGCSRLRNEYVEIT